MKKMFKRSISRFFHRGHRLSALYAASSSLGEEAWGSPSNVTNNKMVIQPSPTWWFNQQKWKPQNEPNMISDFSGWKNEI